MSYAVEIKRSAEREMEDRNELPEGWVWVPFGDVCAINPRHERGALADDELVSFVPMAAVDHESGTIPGSSARPYGEVRKGFTHFAEGDVLFARITPCMENGKVAVAHSLVNGLGCGTTEFHVLRPLGGILPEYIHRYLRQESFRRAAAANMSGTAGQLRVPTDYVKSVELPLAPLPEQRRIVAKIEALFAQSRTARQALDHIPPLLKKFRQSVLAAAFRGDLTRDWREQHPDVEPASVLLERIRAERRCKWEKDLRAKGKDPRKMKYEEPKLVDSSELPELPRQWAWANVGWLAASEPYSLVDGPFGSNLKTADYVNEGVRVVRLQNIGEGEFRDTDRAFISREKFEGLKRHSIYPGDLIIATLGDPVARVCRFPIDHPTAMVKADCIRFKVDVACAESLYVMWALNTVEAHKRAEMAAHGVGRLRVNLNEIKQLPVPLAPLSEQQQIVAKIRELFALADAIEAGVEAAWQQADRIDQSILARAFRGELVPQDPNDEPASALLERIHAERPKERVVKRSAACGSKNLPFDSLWKFTENYDKVR